jgi:hypothetical protein
MQDPLSGQRYKRVGEHFAAAAAVRASPPPDAVAAAAAAARADAAEWMPMPSGWQRRRVGDPVVIPGALGAGALVAGTGTGVQMSQQETAPSGQAAQEQDPEPIDEEYYFAHHGSRATTWIDPRLEPERALDSVWEQATPAMQAGAPPGMIRRLEEEKRQRTREQMVDYARRTGAKPPKWPSTGRGAGVGGVGSKDGDEAEALFRGGGAIMHMEAHVVPAAPPRKPVQDGQGRLPQLPQPPQRKFTQLVVRHQVSVYCA